MADEHDNHDNRAGLAEQVDRLRLVVEELHAAQAAQRADDAGAERWQARLSSLETRLSMVESTFRSEAERVQGAVRTVEALTTSLRDVLDRAEAVSAVGRDLDERIQRLDTTIAAHQPDTVALAAEVGRRVEEVAQAPARAMTEALAEHLEQNAERERTVASALESLTGQLNQFTGTLAGEIRRASQDSVDASRAELDNAIRAVAEASATVAAAGDVTARVDLAIAAVGELRQEFATRMAQSGTAVAQQVREALTDRLAIGDPTPALEAMRADLRQAVRAVTEHRADGPDLLGPIEALAHDVGILGTRLDELRARSEGTSLDLAALAGVPATLGKLVGDLEPLATLPASIDGFGGAVEGAVTLHRRSAEALTTLQQAVDAARAEIGAAASATQHLTGRLDEATTAAAEANRAALDATLAEQRELEVARAGIVEGRLATLASDLDQRLTAVAAAVDGLADRPADGLTRQQLDEALGALATTLTDGPAVPTVDDLNAAVATLVERLGDIPAPVSTADLDAAVAGLRLAIAGLPAVPGADEVAAAVRVTLPEQLATASDVDGAVGRVLAAVDARLSGNVLEDFRAEIGRVVEFRAEMLSAIAELRKSSPAAAATGDDVQAAAEGVVGALREAVAEAVGDVRGDLGAVRRAVESLDAIGRLVRHAISSLHLVEEATVGVTSGSVRARTEIAAALAELEAARSSGLS